MKELMSEQSATDFNKWTLYLSAPKMLAFLTLLFLLIPQANGLSTRSTTRKAEAKPDPFDKDTLILETSDDNVVCPDNYTVTYFADSTYPSNNLKLVVINGFQPACSTTNVTESFYLPVMKISEDIESGILCNGSPSVLPINDWQYAWSDIMLSNDNTPCKGVILYSNFDPTSNPQFIQCVEENLYSVTKKFTDDDNSCYEDESTGRTVTSLLMAFGIITAICVAAYIRKICTTDATRGSSSTGMFRSALSFRSNPEGDIQQNQIDQMQHIVQLTTYQTHYTQL